jgi:hypothetical protein
LGDPTPRRAVIREDQGGNDSSCVPREVGGDLLGKPHLHVDGPEQSLHIGDDCLDLDDQQDPTRRVERQQVDAAALAEPAERDLRTDLPGGRLEPFRDQLLERCVPGIQESVELPTTPSAVDPEVDFNRFADPLQRPNGEPGRSMPFELRNGSSAHAGAAGQVRLPPSEAKP